jgi:cobyrinic acid a,c-diamide synthase
VYGVYISAAHKSSGKTTITVGLTAALTERGTRVRTFKKGPDFIDPLWHGQASGAACYNLDFNTMNPGEIERLFAEKSCNFDISIIEGNKGLYDGVDILGTDNNAAMAKLLNVPVVLVLDTSGITRGIAPLVLGYQAFAPELNIAGVILNKVVSPRHEQKIQDVLEHYTDVKIVGAVGRDKRMLAPERHLGLVPPEETPEVNRRISQLAELVKANVNIDELLDIATCAKPRQKCIEAAESSSLDENNERRENAHKQQGLRIGIIRDAAFGFYYADDLEAFEDAGCELVFVNAIRDRRLPEIDGLFIGGGFPETHIKPLAANIPLRQSIKEAVVRGLPVYAECGGLMYLSRSIRWGDDFGEMVGAIPGDVIMHKKPKGRGLVVLEVTKNNPWLDDLNARRIPAHEFHYASLENLPEDTKFIYKVCRGYGIDGKNDGIAIYNTVAGFSHLRNTGQTPWVTSFVRFARSVSSK